MQAFEFDPLLPSTACTLLPVTFRLCAHCNAVCSAHDNMQSYVAGSLRLDLHWLQLLMHLRFSSLVCTLQCAV